MKAGALVGVPDSFIIKQAQELVRENSEPYLVNHVMRSWFFAALLAKQAKAVALDPELLAIATLLHDLGLTAKYTTNEKRFEVDGANAARNFLQSHRIAPAEVQLVWDAIALHTTRSIALYKEPVVAFCHSGVQVDISGTQHNLIEPDVMEQILREFPRLSLKTRLTDCLCGVVQRKPETTYDNFMRDFGDRFISGYKARSSVDRLTSAPFDD